MKINLEEPYSREYRFGYLVRNPDGRQTVILYNNSSDRSSVSYARYLMAVKIGDFVPSDLDVDHIDEDKTNDSIDNLQLLSKIENHHKTHKTGETFYDFVCPVCSKDFKLSARQSHKVKPTCSRRCGGIKSSWSRIG